MTTYIKGPDTGKVSFLRTAGAFLLEQPPERLAPTGTYICVLLGAELDVAMVLEDLTDLRSATRDMRMKNWLHVTTDLLKHLLEPLDPDSV